MSAGLSLGGARQQLERMLRSNETKRYASVTKGRKEPLFHLRGIQLAGVCCLQEHTSNSEGETSCFPEGESICTGRYREAVLNLFAQELLLNHGKELL